MQVSAVPLAVWWWGGAVTNVGDPVKQVKGRRGTTFTALSLKDQ